MTKIRSAARFLLPLPVGEREFASTSLRGRLLEPAALRRQRLTVVSPSRLSRPRFSSTGGRLAVAPQLGAQGWQRQNRRRRGPSPAANGERDDRHKVGNARRS